MTAHFFSNFICISMLLACAVVQLHTIMVQIFVPSIGMGFKTFSPHLNTVVSSKVADICLPEIINISWLHVQKEALRFLGASSIMVMGMFGERFSWETCEYLPAL